MPNEKIPSTTTGIEPINQLLADNSILSTDLSSLMNLRNEFTSKDYFMNTSSLSYLESTGCEKHKSFNLKNESKRYETGERERDQDSSNDQSNISNDKEEYDDDDDDDDGNIKFASETLDQRLDRRKHNKGSAHRKSYPKEVKKRAIALRDSGLSVEEIARILDTAKSNVEKWCSIKVNL